MWNPVFGLNFVVIAASLIGSWLGAIALLLYFAKRERSLKAKTFSLVVPIGMAVFGLALAAGLLSRTRNYSSDFHVLLENLMLGGLALAFVSLTIFSVLAFAHFVAFAIRYQKIAYGLSALILFAQPLYVGLNAYLTYRRNEIEIASVKHAAEPSIALCCAGSAAGCHEVADAFKKISPLRQYRGWESDLGKKYSGTACRYGSEVDCRWFAASLGAVGEKYKDDWFYKMECDPKDLYSEPPPPLNPEEF